MTLRLRSFTLRPTLPASAQGNALRGCLGLFLGADGVYVLPLLFSPLLLAVQARPGNPSPCPPSPSTRLRSSRSLGASMLGQLLVTLS